MASFQFQCPSGHLLEGDEAQAGQTCTCPTCGTLFIVPAPVAAAPSGGFGGFGGESAAQPAAFGAGPSEGVGGDIDNPSQPKVLHIPCPNGHELETPIDMLGQQAICPHCNEQFLLEEAASVEFKRRRRQEREKLEEKVGNRWLGWAIGIAVFVIIGLVVLIALSSGTGGGGKKKAVLPDARTTTRG